MPAKQLPPVISTDDYLVRLCDLPVADRCRILNDFARQIEQVEETRLVGRYPWGQRPRRTLPATARRRRLA